MNADTSEARKHLPPSPGVYQFFNETGDLLYIGKAKNLAKRVNSYWQRGGHTPWVNSFIPEVATIKITEVSSEIEALMLENSLIKSLRPKYNIQLRDDKTFPFLRISHEPFPAFSIVRRVKQDKARYLGPYLSATYLRSMLKLLQGLYGIKTAKDQSYEARSSVPNQIGLGPRDLDNSEQYNANVEEAIRFMSRPHPDLERELRRAMQEAAEDEAFERAAILRNRLQALEQLRTDQSLFGADSKQRDYLGIATAGRLNAVYILCEREGKITDHKDFLFELPSGLSENDRITRIVSYLYIQGITIPQEIVLPAHAEQAELLEHTLGQLANRKVILKTPQRGELTKRLTTATENAAYQLKLESLKKHRREMSLSELASLLNLPRIPKRIEACDISNLGSNHIVGATVVFIDGQPAKKEYRKYTITTPKGQDDFASMRELVFRRVSNKERPLPDLLLIDGGKGQLSAACDALKLANVSLPIAALAKKEELIFLPHKAEPLALPKESGVLLLLMALRDEVHRFVITFHRQRRGKRFLS